jgi:hypothetical protein
MLQATIVVGEILFLFFWKKNLKGKNILSPRRN